MRQLQSYVNMILKWTGTFVFFGEHRICKTPTLLLIDIKCDEMDLKLDHAWININDQLNELNLKKGQIISFNANIKPYRKGKMGSKLDYGLHNIHGCEIIGFNKRLDPIKKLPPSRRINVKDIMSKESDIPKK